jgi:alpha-mannosidase
MSSFGSFYSSLVSQRDSVPVERGEQNSVFEGCYTSQAAIKSNNRKAEALLMSTETFATIAMSYGGEYPGEKLEQAWHNVLFNQFHDILCGSGIHDVALDADQFYAHAFAAADDVLRASLNRIASKVNTSAKNKNATALMLFNPLSWTRSGPAMIRVKTASSRAPRIIDSNGREVPSLVTDVQHDSTTVLFFAADVPSVGYKTYWITSQKPRKSRVSTDLVMKNQWLEVAVDLKTGSVSRIYDRRAHRELLVPGQFLNQLQICEDDTQMSAWVIGLRGEPRFIDQPTSVRMVESGDLRSVIRSEYRYEQSTFVQDVILYANRRQVDFRFEGDWHHRKRLLKIVFPLAVAADTVSCDIPFAAIDRPTNGREIVAQKWIDLSSPEYGVTLVNDSKYGFDVKGSVIRMTALRSPTDPDPKADEGHHEFRYALCPHPGGWREGQSVRRGYEFNTPLIALHTGQHQGSLLPTFSFVQIDNPDLVLAAMKKSEDDSDIVLRVYEASGQPKRGTISLWNPFTDVRETNLIEWNPTALGHFAAKSRTLILDWKPTEIKTLKLSMVKSQ